MSNAKIEGFTYNPDYFRKKIVYMSGPISGRDDYTKNFRTYRRKLENSGYVVLNPACLPYGMPKERYMPICMAMIDQADVVVLLPGWEESKGSLLELQYAEYQGKEICCIDITDGATANPDWSEI